MRRRLQVGEKERERERERQFSLPKLAETFFLAATN
jgi:hypothetical protein